MKVISKPKLPIQRCICCGSILKIGYKDLKTNGMTLLKDIYYCKVCNGQNIVKFEQGETKNET